MPRKSKYSIEQRVQACKDYRSGTRSLKEICISLGTPREKTIMEWSKKYEKYGIMAFQEHSGNKSYTKEFKLRVVEEYIAGLGSLQDLIKTMKKKGNVLYCKIMCPRLILIKFIIQNNSCAS